MKIKIEDIDSLERFMHWAIKKARKRAKSKREHRYQEFVAPSETALEKTKIESGTHVPSEAYNRLMSREVIIKINRKIGDSHEFPFHEGRTTVDDVLKYYKRHWFKKHRHKG